MSALNLSKAVIAGHITAMPELKQTPGGVACTTFSVAVNRSGEGGTSETDFFTIVAWRQTAEFICRYFVKGSAIYLEGRIRNRSYTDKNNVKRTVTEIVADTASFVDSKSSAPKEEPKLEPAPTIPHFEQKAFTDKLEAADDSDLPF